MADFDWPTSLPDFLVAGFQGGGGDDGVLRSRVGRGGKTRPHWTTAPPQPLTATIRCTQAQKQTLLDFYNITLRRARAFNHRDPSKPDTTPVEFRFLGYPSWVPSRGAGRYWDITIQLEQLTDFQGEFPLDIEGLST